MKKFLKDLKPTIDSLEKKDLRIVLGGGDPNDSSGDSQSSTSGGGCVCACSCGFPHPNPMA